jgi:hypothetical protein
MEGRPQVNLLIARVDLQTGTNCLIIGLESRSSGVANTS